MQNKKIAVKRILKNSEKKKAYYEIDILIKLDNKYIIKYYYFENLK